jgi:hypothetical protein
VGKDRVRASAERWLAGCVVAKRVLGLVYQAGPSRRRSRRVG